MHYELSVEKTKVADGKHFFTSEYIYALQHIFGSLTLCDIMERLKNIMNLSISYSWDKFYWNAIFLTLMIGVKMYYINIYRKKISHNRNGWNVMCYFPLLCLFNYWSNKSQQKGRIYTERTNYKFHRP